MQYLLLIYANENTMDDMPPEQRGAMFAEYKTFTEDIVKTGAFKGGDALQPVANATSVQVRDGKTITTDGPFAETKEQLGGYYLVDAANLDEAIATAARIPTAKYGTIEVRPILVIEGM